MRSTLDIDNNGDDETTTNDNGNRNSVISNTIIDTFGFSLTTKQFTVLLVLVGLMLGTSGTIAFILLLGIYTGCQRMMNGEGRDASSGNDNGRGGHSWGGHGSSNVRGMKDLPKPPPRG